MEGEENLEVVDEDRARDEPPVHEQPQHVVRDQVRRLRIERRIGPAAAIAGRAVGDLTLHGLGEADQCLRLHIDVVAEPRRLGARINAGEEELFQPCQRDLARVGGRVTEHFIQLLVRAV